MPASRSSGGTGTSIMLSPFGTKAKTCPACQARAVRTDFGIEIWNLRDNIVVSC